MLSWGCSQAFFCLFLSLEMGTLCREGSLKAGITSENEVSAINLLSPYLSRAKRFSQHLKWDTGRTVSELLWWCLKAASSKLFNH